MAFVVVGDGVGRGRVAGLEAKGFIAIVSESFFGLNKK